MQTQEETLEDIFQKYHGTEDELIPLLQDIQELYGYLPAEAMQKAADFLGVPAADVYGVATFYSQFYLTPQGKHKIRVCMGTACYVRGGKQIMERLERNLGIKAGETTHDCECSLERVACFGSCALAPVMVVDDQVHGRVTPAKAEKILENIS